MRMDPRVTQQRRLRRTAAAEPGSEPSAKEVRLGTLVALDARLLVELEADNQRLEGGVDTAVRALAERDHRAASAAFALCSEDLQRLQWIEALSLFPPLFNRSAVDAVAAGRVQQVREALTAAATVLRGHLDDGARVDGIDPDAARLALGAYLSIKRDQLYPLYHALVDSDRGD
jgi:hypothetical protein